MTKLILRIPSLERGAGRKASFAILEKHADQTFSTLKEPRLEAINKLFLDNVLDRPSAIAQAKRLVEQLRLERGERKVTFTLANQNVLEKFWDKYKLRDLIDPDSAYADFRRALEALGDLPVVSASEDEMQRALTKFKGEKHRRLVSRLNSVLKWLGRECRLRPAKPEGREVNYLNEGDINLLCVHANPELKVLIRFLFYTGLRVGEAFAVNQQSVRADGTLRVTLQLDKSGKHRPTKTRKTRLAFVAATDVVLEWIEIVKTQNRVALSQAFRRLCWNVLKRELSVHDLRHSYAIYLVSKGVSISQVAQSLGNSVVVCERYYSGFVLTDESIETIKRQLASTHTSS